MMPWALTENEKLSVKLAARGLNAREIGGVLGISEVAAQERLKSAAVRLGARNRHHLTAMAVARGVAHPDDIIESAEEKRAA